jgi:hypothetical protein
MWRHYSLALLIAAAATVAGCDTGVNGDVTAGPGGGSTVNGSVHVPAGLHSGAVATVNGSISIGDNATVATAHAVNGGVDLGAHAAADSVTTVNGPVTLGAGARVAGGVTSVNGAIKLAGGAAVGGAVKNVNGHIMLTAAHVAGGLRTVDGDIDVSGGSRLEGGILVEKPGTDFFGSHSHTPRIVIGPDAVVQGNLRFERDVLLYVSDKATIGAIEGATAIRFSGDKPPG